MTTVKSLDRLVGPGKYERKFDTQTQVQGIALRKGQAELLDWVNCGLCVDERGVGEAIPGTRRGSPADLLKFAENSLNTLIIPTR